MLSKSRSNQICLDDEAEMPKVRRIARRVYDKSEVGIQTSIENVNKEVSETNFSQGMNMLNYQKLQWSTQNGNITHSMTTQMVDTQLEGRI